MTELHEAPWATWVWHPATDQMSWSQAMHELFGTDARVLAAPQLNDLLLRVTQEDRSRVKRAVHSASATLCRTTIIITRHDTTQVSAELCIEATPSGVLGSLQPRPDRATHQRDSFAVLAGGIAHDFNNLLVGIMGNLDLARYGDVLPRDTALHLSAAMQAAERAAELCRQLLAFSGRGPSRFETVDVNARLRRIAGLLSGSLPRHAELELQLSDTPLPISIDPGQFTQLLLNLLTNAVEASAVEASPDHGAHVRLRTQWRDGANLATDEFFIAGAAMSGPCVAVVIEDAGVGMDATLQARLCEPFFSTKGAGRGLGLAAAQGIVRNHGGAMAISTAPGSGTRVSVLLPASGAAVRTADGATLPRQTHTVLVVDDEATVRDVMRLQLEKLGYHTRALNNGRDCVEHVLMHPQEIDAVILDQTMPVMGGTEAYQRLRDIAPTLPIILMTGFGQDHIAGLIDTDRRALFLPKPYALNRLQNALRELLGE